MRKHCSASKQVLGMIKRTVPILMFLTVLGSGAAHAEMIDLNDFFFYLGDPVTVLSDGSSATLLEDSFISPVLLSNDPGLGDSVVILAEVGGVGQILSFDYDFDEAAGNDDEFGAFVLDEWGVSAGPSFEFFVTHSDSGTVSFDLSSLAGETLGLQFQLTALPDDDGLDSSLTVSNVQLNPVPLPGAVLLGVLGLGVAGSRLRRRREI